MINYKNNIVRFIVYVLGTSSLFGVSGIMFVQIPLFGVLVAILISPFLLIAGKLLAADFITTGSHVEVTAAGIRIISSEAWAAYISSFAIVGAIVGVIYFFKNEKAERWFS